MGKRFELTYIDKDGKEKTPVIIHRAPLGSHERFIGFLIEHYAGSFPLWLTPVQIKIIPISEHHHAYAQKIAQDMKKTGLRVEINDRPDRMQKKIRDAQLEKVYYMAIIGDKEIESKSISIRQRNGEQFTMAVDEFVNQAKNKIITKTIE